MIESTHTEGVVLPGHDDPLLPLRPRHPSLEHGPGRGHVGIPMHFSKFKRRTAAVVVCHLEF